MEEVLKKVMKIVATIESRMTSSRLPGKSMMKILNKPMLSLLIERVMKCKEIDEIIVATTSNDTDNEIEELAKNMNVKCYRGSENDVLGRVLNAVKICNADIILELWGDSPLIDPKLLDEIVIYYLKHNFDCVGTMLPNFKKTFPLGLSTLIFSTKILEEVNNITNDPDDRENVSNYIYEHPEKYKIGEMPCPPELNFPDLRFTVDEENDFKVVKKIFEELYPKNLDFSAVDVVNFLNHHKEVKSINSEVEQKKLTSWDKFKNYNS